MTRESPDSSAPAPHLGPGSGRRTAGRAAVETLLVFAVFFVAAADPPPAANEQHYLSRLKHYWDPAWCPGDPFLECPDAHLTIVLLAGWTTRLLSLPAVAWLGRFLAWGLLAWAWGRLSWAITPHRGAAALAAGLWLVGMEQGHFAGEWVIGGVESKCFAYVFVLLGATAMVENRWPWVGVHLGVATALHALVGGWSVLIALGVWTLQRTDRPTIRAMAPSLTLGGLLGLAGVLPPLMMNLGESPDVIAEANQIYVFDRLPHHLAPLSQPTDWVLNRVGRHALVLVLLMAATRWVVKHRAARLADAVASQDRLMTICRFAWGAVLLLAIGLTIELLASAHPAFAAGLLRYYWFRMSDVAAPLAISLVATAAITSGLAKHSNRALAACVACVAVIIAHLGPETLARVNTPRGLGDKRVADLPAWEAMADWIARNTPPDTLLLTPKQANSLRWRTGRAELVTWKDIPQDAASIVAWRRRLDDVFSYEAPDGERRHAPSLGHLGRPRLRELGEKYGADYAVTDHRRPVSLPVVYRNLSYVVYQLRDD